MEESQLAAVRRVTRARSLDESLGSPAVRRDPEELRAPPEDEGFAIRVPGDLHDSLVAFSRARRANIRKADRRGRIDAGDVDVPAVEAGLVPEEREFPPVGGPRGSGGRGSDDPRKRIESIERGPALGGENGSGERQDEHPVRSYIR